MIPKSLRFLSFIFALFTLAAGLTPARAQVVVNEIMYRPGTTFPEDTALEFIELHNPTAAPVDISGWALTSGTAFTFPASTVIAAGGFVVVASSPSAVQTAYGIGGVFGPWAAGSTLSNSGEKIALSKPGVTAGTFVQVDAVTYASEGDWSVRVRETTFNGWAWLSAADSGGKSLEVRNAAISNDNGQNWLASTAAAGGTPGAVNTALSANVPPIIHDVKHSPAVPTAAQDVTISCDVTDETAPAGLTATLYYREATTTTPGLFQTQAMAGDGTGKFSTVLAPRVNNLVIVEFYVSVNDGALTRTWPAPTGEGQNANCQFIVSNEARTATDSYYWLVLTAAENAAFNGVNSQSDRQFNMTFVSTRGSESTIRYRSSMRIRGNSSRTYQFRPLRISLPNEDRWDGISDFPLNPRASFLQFLGMRLFQAAGLAADDSIPIELRRNGVESTTSTGGTPDYGKWVRAEQIGGDYAGNHYPTAANKGGDIYKKIDNGGGDNWYWSGNFAGPGNPDMEVLGWTKQNNAAENDWTALTNFFTTWQTAAVAHFPGSPAGDVAGSNFTRQSGTGVWNGTVLSAAEYAAVENVSDLQQWARHFAAMTIVQDLETKIANGVDDDYSIYIPPADGSGHRKMQLLPHDLDTIFGLGDNQQAATYTGLFNMTEDGQSAYGFRTLLPLVGTTAVAGNATFRTMYLDAIRELYGSVFNADTGVSANPPFYQFVDNHLTGWAPEATITAIKNFATARQAHLLGLIGSGAITPPAATSSGTLTSAPGTLMIHEILAQNVAALNHAGTFPDAIEIFNNSGLAVNLAGKSLTDDPTVKARYVFPAGTIIGAGSYLTVYADAAATPGLHTGFGLDSEGDALYLYDTVASGQALLDSVVFGPQAADYSIGRTGGTRDLWQLCTPTISAANSAVVTFAEPGGVTINEWSANNDYLLDEDFVELYNPAAQPVAIGQMALTDDFINYPAGHVLPPLSFIGPAGFVRFIAKGSSADPASAGQLPFSIDQDFGWLALIGLNGTIVDREDIVAQTFNTSVGRTPDGAATLAVFGLPVNVPTPGAANVNPPASVLALLNNLRISEILYTPGNLEYIELHNIGTSPLELAGVRFTRGVTYTFPATTTLAAGAYLVVCRDRTAFQNQFGLGVPLAPGVFTGSLDNAGEVIAFQPPAPWDVNLLKFAYSPTWFVPQTNNGYALSVIDDGATAARDWGDKSTWTPSLNLYGTPGAGPPPTVTSASLASGVIGDPFSYQITATQTPTRYGATGLPAGVSVNTVNGLISGAPTESGVFNLVVSATNIGGTGTKNVTLTVAASGPIASFTWSTIGGTQLSGVPFAATLTAKDFAARTVTSFNGNSTVIAQGTGTTAAIVLITECGTNSPDYFEIQNVGNVAANTAGWFIIPNDATGMGTGGLNSIHPAWPLPATIAPGQVIVVNEATPGVYAPSINWSGFTFGGGNRNGWCMLCDGTGAVRDFVGWGYTAANITAINIPSVTVGSTTYTNIRVLAAQWSGNGATAINFQGIKTRGGTTDLNTAVDWTEGASDANKGIQNTGLTVPFIPPPPTYTVTPSSVTLTSGVWSGNLSITSVVNTIHLVANDGAGHTGNSNNFNVAAAPPPVITSPNTARAVVGGAFSYQITATNLPTSYNASGLPAGLTVSTSTGLISGTPSAAGVAIVSLSATNSGGPGGRTLSLDVQTDLDGHGMGDAWETANGLSVGTNDAGGDLDGDGLRNLAEWIAGTVPNDPASGFIITNVQVSGSDVVLTWKTVVGKRYRVHSRPDLVAGSWSQITPAPIVATGATATFTHTGGASGAQRNYRVSTEP